MTTRRRDSRGRFVRSSARGTVKRRSNPVRPLHGWSRHVISGNIERLRRDGVPAAAASARAYEEARKSWRTRHPREKLPAHLARQVRKVKKASKRKTNPVARLNFAVVQDRQLIAGFLSRARAWQYAKALANRTRRPVQLVQR